MELQKVYRQENRHFLRLLEAVRLNRVDYDDLEDLNRRCLPHFEPEILHHPLRPQCSGRRHQ